MPFKFAWQFKAQDQMNVFCKWKCPIYTKWEMFWHTKENKCHMTEILVTEIGLKTNVKKTKFVLIDIVQFFLTFL